MSIRQKNKVLKKLAETLRSAAYFNVPLSCSTTLINLYFKCLAAYRSIAEHDIVTHPDFGMGAVRWIDRGWAEVSFEKGIKRVRVKQCTKFFAEDHIHTFQPHLKHAPTIPPHQELGPSQSRPGHL